jgi:DNA-binding transcriptional ArsR family regulator
MVQEPPPRGSVRVRDPQALRALAHPLRGRLLALLRLEGPSTATLLGQRLQESSGSTSYHLRQLAAHGFVEEVEGHGTGRERWWRAAHRSTAWETADLLGQPGGREVSDELLHQQLGQQTRVLARFAAEEAALSDEWRVAVSLNDWGLRLPPHRARALADELNAVLRRYQDELEEEGAPLVHVLLDVFPLAKYPL